MPRQKKSNHRDTKYHALRQQKKHARGLETAWRRMGRHLGRTERQFCSSSQRQVCTVLRGSGQSVAFMRAEVRGGQRQSSYFLGSFENDAQITSQWEMTIPRMQNWRSYKPWPYGQRETMPSVRHGKQTTDTKELMYLLPVSARGSLELHKPT